MSTQRSPDALWSRLKASLLSSQAEAPLAQREAAFAGPRHGADGGQALPPHVVAIVDKVHRHAYKLTDEDVQAALAAGVSQEALFELIVIAAVGAATQRLEAGQAAVGAAPAQESDRAS
jgi:alkylhydroperoxidase family enzyme